MVGFFAFNSHMHSQNRDREYHFRSPGVALIFIQTFHLRWSKVIHSRDLDERRGSIILHLLTSSEDLATTIAPRGKLLIVAIATVNSIRLRTKLLIHQRNATFIAEEACFVPVFVLIREILQINKINDIQFMHKSITSERLLNSHLLWFSWKN